MTLLVLRYEYELFSLIARRTVLLTQAQLLIQWRRGFHLGPKERRFKEFASARLVRTESDQRIAGERIWSIT